LVPKSPSLSNDLNNPNVSSSLNKLNDPWNPNNSIVANNQNNFECLVTLVFLKKPALANNCNKLNRWKAIRLGAQLLAAGESARTQEGTAHHRYALSSAA
jgi:hypothetical protein